MNEDSGVVAHECNPYLTKAETVWKPAKNNAKNNVNAGKRIQKKVQYDAVSKKTSQEAVQVHAKKIMRRTRINYMMTS